MVGVITMFLVYIALQTSMKVPSLDRLPILPGAAISIVMENDDGFANSYNSDDFTTRYVYIKGNGSIFESDPNSNSIGEYLGSRGNSLYYVDSITGDIIVKSNLSEIKS
jgi:hypothetical protein